MSKGKDGGPAFPQDYEHTKAAILTHQAGEISAEQLLHCARQLRGMTLRDYFAAEAMQGMVSAEFAGNVTTDYWAEEAYKVADAMLKARQE